MENARCTQTGTARDAYHGFAKQVMGNNPSSFKDVGLDAPVESVAWNQANEFCGKLQGLLLVDLRDKVARLPTEAEWGYACRAGTRTGRGRERH